MLAQIRAIIALLFGMSFMMMASGLHGVLIPVRGDLESFSSFQLGWIGTGFAFGFTIGCLLIPRLVRRVGHIRTFSTLTALLSVSILMNALFVDAALWIVLRAASGFCIAGCYMVAESWLNERTSNEMRGSMFSIYAITTMVGMMAGQYMLVLADVKATTLFMLGAILYALAVVPTSVSKAQSPAPLNEVDLKLTSLFSNSPAAFVGAILCGIISSAWTVFGPVFGQQSGMSNASIATLLVCAMVGSVMFQYPLGRLSDLIDRRYAMAIAGMIGIMTGTLMTTMAEQGQYGLPFYLAVVAYGGVIFSIYSLVVAHANDFAEPGDFVKVSSGLLILFGLGTMAGPLIAAQMMDWTGPSGVFATTTVAHLLFASYAIYRSFRRKGVQAEQQSDFQTVGMARNQTPESYRLDPRSMESVGDGEEDALPPMPPPVRVE